MTFQLQFQLHQWNSDNGAGGTCRLQENGVSNTYQVPLRSTSISWARA